MTKGEIIERILKEMRIGASVKRRRSNEEDAEEQDAIDHLENLLRDAEPDEDILTCADFVDLKVECCTTCHYFMLPYDMPRLIRLKNGEYAWLCCAIQSAIKRAPGGDIPVKSPAPEQPTKSMGYKPFADFFGGKIGDDDDE